MLFRAGLLRAKVMDIPMAAVYGDETSGLKPLRVMPSFLLHNLRNFGKRILYNYFLRDFNIASLEMVLGVLFIAFVITYGLLHWGVHQPATAGAVMIATLPLLTGIIFLIGAVNFDMQQVPRETISPRLPPFLQ
jgi:dolichol-phosphate mannosyltransferase